MRAITSPSDLERHTGGYDRVSIALHTIIVLGVAFQWLGAHAIDWFPKGPLRVDARSVHIGSGLVLGVALIAMMYWRALRGIRFKDDQHPALAATAMAIHVGLYAVLMIVIALGFATEWIRGDDIFGLFRIPAYGTLDAESRHLLAHRFVDTHRFWADLLLYLAGFHAAAALFHHWVLKDDVLRRMTPVIRRPVEPLAGSDRRES